MLVRTYLTVATIMMLFCLGFVASGDAFRIVEMRPDNNSSYEDTDYGATSQTIWHVAYLRTDEPYYSVTWYVNNVVSGYSYGGHVATEATFWPHWLTGDISGANYVIKAVACRMDKNPLSTDTDSYNLVVWKPKIRQGVERIDVYGYSELTKQYYDNGVITTSQYVHARGGSRGGDLFWRFIHKVIDPNGQLVDELKEEYKDENGVPALYKLAPGASYTSPTVDLSIPIGVRKGEFTSKAYVNLYVEGTEIDAEGRKREVTDSWPVTNEKKFKQ